MTSAVSEPRPYQHLYRKQRWRKMRLRQLQKHPLCAFCLEQGRITPANVADHTVPHKGDERLFFDEGNLQSLCASCHNSDKQREERSTKPRVGVDGWPTE